MPPGANQGHGLAARFHVAIDGQDLGNWSKCSGLEVDFQNDPYPELGNNAFVHLLPKGAKYVPIVLERACTPAESNRLKNWLSSMVQQPSKGTASITLLDARANEVVTWTLGGVFPAKWIGPTLEGSSPHMATETLHLAHEGFLS